MADVASQCIRGSALAIMQLVVISAARDIPQCNPTTNPGYSVDVVERSLGPGGGAVISKANGTSSFDYSFTTAWFPGRTEQERDGLVVRVGNNTRRPWFTGKCNIVCARTHTHTHKLTDAHRLYQLLCIRATFCRSLLQSAAIAAAAQDYLC